MKMDGGAMRGRGIGWPQLFPILRSLHTNRTTVLFLANSQVEWLPSWSEKQEVTHRRLASGNS